MLKRLCLIDRAAAAAGLDGADLSGADLSTSQGLTQAQLGRACGSQATRLPPGLVLRSRD